jgi:hypothetical protein
VFGVLNDLSTRWAQAMGMRLLVAGGADPALFGLNSGRGFACSVDFGALWFDFDWANPGNAVQIASLTPGTQLGAANFTVLA